MAQVRRRSASRRASRTRPSSRRARRWSSRSRSPGSRSRRSSGCEARTRSRTRTSTRWRSASGTRSSRSAIPTAWTTDRTGSSWTTISEPTRPSSRSPSTVGRPETADSLTTPGIFVHSTHTHSFNGPFSGTTWVSRYQKGKTSPDFTEARDSEWQWHQLSHMQVCTLLQTDTMPAPYHSVLYRPDALPAAQPTASKH